MDILEKKQKGEFNDEVKKLISQLQFLNNPIDIKGSSSLKSQQYFSDYDLFTAVGTKNNPNKVFDTFVKMFKKISDDDDNYFIEFKIQLKDGDKIRWYNLDEFDKKEFVQIYEEIDFCKIDLIVRIENKFIEVSCIYKFSDESSEDYEENLKEDIKELEKEGNYYKALKRKFNIYKAQGDGDKLLELTKIFNSELGEKYQTISNLEAIRKLLEITDDSLTIKKILINLKDIGLEPNVKKIDKTINSLKKDINSKAKKLKDHFKI